MTFLTDDRAASTTVTHALAIGISSLLVLTLLFGLGGFLDGQQKNAADRQFEVVGERVATELSKANRYARANGDTVTVRVSHPERIAGNSYQIAVEDESAGCDPDRICVVVMPSETGTAATRTIPLKLQPAGITHATVVEDDRQVVSGGSFEISVEWDGTSYVVRLEV